MEDERREEAIRVKVRLVNPDEVPIQHANYIFVVHTQDEFFVTFAQAHPPYLLSISEQDRKELEATGLPARVVARLMVSPTKMKEFIDVLNENYGKFLARKGG